MVEQFFLNFAAKYFTLSFYCCLIRAILGGDFVHDCS